jgi:hypothetical protein
VWFGRSCTMYLRESSLQRAPALSDGRNLIMQVRRGIEDGTGTFIQRGLSGFGKCADRVPSAVVFVPATHE